MSQKTSATGGFLIPNPQPTPVNTTPAGLSFIQFIQQLLVGLSTFDGSLVRPQWQQEPPKQPDINTNWLAFGLGNVAADFNAYQSTVIEENVPVSTMERQETLPLIISVYGPAAYDNITLVRDGFQLTQNLTTLRQANVGFAYDTQAQHVPDFFNERWYDRWRMEIYIRRVVQRFYPILTFASASGVIYTQTAQDDNFQLPFAGSGE